VGQLFDCRSKLDQVIRERKLDQIKVYGDIGLKAGFLISLIKSATPDDDVKIEKFRKAAQEVVRVSVYMFPHQSRRVSNVH
jgi:hypothetical protein